MAAICLAAWSLYGCWAMPALTQIFKEALQGASLPWMAGILCHLRPAGCVMAGLVGAMILVGIHLAIRSRLAERAVLLLLLTLPVWAAVEQLAAIARQN